MVVVFQVGGELIKQEGFIPEEGCFLEGIKGPRHIPASADPCWNGQRFARNPAYNG